MKSYSVIFMVVFVLALAIAPSLAGPRGFSGAKGSRHTKVLQKCPQDRGVARFMAQVKMAKNRLVFAAPLPTRGTATRPTYKHAKIWSIPHKPYRLPKTVPRHSREKRSISWPFNCHHVAIYFGQPIMFEMAVYTCCQKCQNKNFLACTLANTYQLAQFRCPSEGIRCIGKCLFDHAYQFEAHRRGQPGSKATIGTQGKPRPMPGSKGTPGSKATIGTQGKPRPMPGSKGTPGSKATIGTQGRPGPMPNHVKPPVLIKVPSSCSQKIKRRHPYLPDCIEETCISLK